MGDLEEPRFETVSTSTLQIRVKVPRSPSPSLRPTTTSVTRSSSMRQSRLESKPPTASTNTLSASRAYKTSRSLSPRPPRSSGDTSRPPPPSPSGLLPTRSPTPPKNWSQSLRSTCCDSAPTSPRISARRLEVPGGCRSGQMTPRSLSSRCKTIKIARIPFFHLRTPFCGAAWLQSFEVREMSKYLFAHLCNESFCSRSVPFSALFSELSMFVYLFKSVISSWPRQKLTLSHLAIFINNCLETNNNKLGKAQNKLIQFESLFWRRISS